MGNRYLKHRSVGVVALIISALVAAPAARRSPQSAADTLNALVSSYTAERKAIIGAPVPVEGALKVDQGPMGTPEQAATLAAQAESFLKKLTAIDVAQLTHDEWVLHGILEYQVRLDAGNSAAFFWLPSLVTPYSSPLRALTTPFVAATLSTAEDLAAYLTGLAQLPATMRAYEVRLEQQAEHGVALPEEELRLSIPFVRSFAVASDSSPLAVAATRLSELSESERLEFQQKVADSIATMVNPSIERLAAYLDGPYRTRTVASVGQSQYPNGDAFYRYQIFRHTGLDMSPQQIHDRGLAEVVRINQDLDLLRIEANFEGSLAEFKTFLRTDERFYPEASEELGERMMAAIRLIEPKMPEYFSKMPKAPYGVRRLAPELEPSMTYGYYGLPSAQQSTGYYYYNGLNPETRSLTMVTAIIFHELLPGHHYQLNLRNENSNLTGMRKTAMYTAYTEGWGEYASDLAREMGAYPDVYAKAGRLGMDLFTSSRLVVDTGMNALGWSRERAMQFMKDNTFESDAQIDTESLRYSTDMPGQALAYKLGALKIRDARERVEQAQGAAFDIRKFHDYLLDAGEMPLGMFDQHFTCWLDGEQHRKTEK